MRPYMLLCVAAAVASVPPAAHAARSYDSCTGMIESLPAVISTQGTWCLGSDLSTGLASGAAITVQTNNVTIDCNGFKLGGLAAGLGTNASGIAATARNNLVVRDCHLRGFRIGVQGSGSGFRIVENRIEASTHRAVSVSGDEHTIRGNLITDTGGGTAGAGSALAVVLSGSGDVLDNTIGGIAARAGSGQGAYGIHVSDGDGAAHVTVSANRVRGLVPDGAGSAIAIRTLATGRVTLLDNVVFGTGIGTGFACANTTGAARGNSSLGFATGMSGCPDDGDNVVKP